MINVVSLFDGTSSGALALERAGYVIDKYYASEINKHAITISNNNYPNIIRLGDIKKWREWNIDWSEIDLILAGFPCQAWSVAGKQLGDNDYRGALIYDLIDIWKVIKLHNVNVKYIFENVRMKKEFITYINNKFDTIPIEINSSLVSAQNRRRLYWTNIEGVDQPIDKHIMLKDIVHETESCEYDLSEYKVPFNKTLQIIDKEVQRHKIGYFGKDSQANRVYSIHGKSVTLCGSGSAKKGQYLFGCITPDRVNQRQEGQRFNTGQKFYTLTASDRHGILIEGCIRKLTPIECERLQGLPDNYTEGVSTTQRYKALGNGFTVPVIEHILSYM